MTKYIISTYKAAIPHIVDTNIAFLEYPLCIYIDDIYYKGSFYHDCGSVDIKTFINTKQPVYIKFKNNAFLDTPRGRLNISETEYNKVIHEKLMPDFYQQYKKDLFSNNTQVTEPKDINEAIEHIKEGNIVTTKFINEMVDKGELLHFNGTVYKIEDGIVCGDCCKEYHPEYLQHLWGTNEINAKTIVALHNYKKLYDITQVINKN